ncbi:MAG: acetylornithine transaminase [Candidatus Aerophobetes bacterium]|nr:acetylornithine transaminase [Candidatus Aerophobetes bacterium]
MDTHQIMELDKKYVMHTYARIPLVVAKGNGVRVQDKEGKKYLDFISGIGVNAIGHCHPKVLNAVKEQSQKILHCSNLYYIEPQAKLAKKLCTLSFADKVFFSNSGAEANEASIKLARKFASKKSGEGKRYEIITMENSFHGRTLTTLTATAQTKYQRGFSPLPRGFKYAPFNDLEGVKKLISDKTCAIMLEPIQGEGGINVSTESFLKGLRELCDKEEILLILDEIQCGLGRTGRLFAYQHYGIEPDIMTLAKPLGGGLPIGAALAKENVAASFEPGDHASTFGGNPLACAAALAFLNVVEEEGLVEKARQMGNYFKNKLEELSEKFPFIREIRGKGLMIGVELEFEGKNIVNECRKQGLLINCISKNVLRFLPSLIIEEDDIDQAVGILDKVLSNIA